MNEITVWEYRSSTGLTQLFLNPRKIDFLPGCTITQNGAKMAATNLNLIVFWNIFKFSCVVKKHYIHHTVRIMAKKKGRDTEKKAALAAKKDAKQEKAARKRISKESRGGAAGDGGDNNSSDDDDDDCSGADSDAVNVDRLLQQYKQQDITAAAALSGSAAAKVVACEGFPLARANATLTVTDDGKKNKDAYLFGGEYHDGANTVVSDQLFKYELATGKWKQLITTTTSTSSTASSSSTPNTTAIRTTTTTTPPPRCAHSAAYYNKCLFIFGGELASATEYHHYKDLWKFHTVKQQWSEIKSTAGCVGAPSARSGAAMAVWKHFLLIFGGFYENAKDQTSMPRWYNDVSVLNLQTEQWLDLFPKTAAHSRLSVRPEPRSACNAAVVLLQQQQQQQQNAGDDCWLIHGGFSKLPASHKNSRLQQQQQDTDDGDDARLQLPASETIVHTDAWVLHLKPLLTGKPPTWERWTSSLSRAKSRVEAHIQPNGRSGVGAVSYNGNLLLFGGVVDQELHHHKLDSTFYNDLAIFHVEKRKFIPIRVVPTTAATAAGSTCAATTTTTSSSATKVKETSNVDAESDGDDGAADNLVQEQDDYEDDNNVPAAAASCGWDLDKLRSSMFAFVDGDGKVVYEKIGAVATKQRTGDAESDEEKEESKEEASSKKSNKRRQEPSPALIVERTEPLPRIKPCLFMNGHTLYVYGGLLEVGDREVTLDDMWCIDLRKSRQWKCIFAGTMHTQVWRGAVHDDDDSYYSNAGGGNVDGDDLTDSEDEKEEAVGEIEETKEEKTKESSSGSSRKQEMAELVETHQLEDVNRTPQPGETLADFYARTSDYWNSKAAAQVGSDSEATPMSTKEVKRGGFALARTRFDELEPIIERLMKLKLQRKQEKELKAEKKSSKSKKSSK